MEFRRQNEVTGGSDEVQQVMMICEHHGKVVAEAHELAHIEGQKPMHTHDIMHHDILSTCQMMHDHI